MNDTVVLVTTLGVSIGVAGFLLATLIKSVRDERRASGIKRIWANFGLSIALALLFFVSWVGHAAAEWGVYRHDQRAHGEPVEISGYLVQFGQSTLENWQSEFLQLFSFVVLAAILIHRGSAESRDGEDRLEKKLDEIRARLDDAGIGSSGAS